MAYLVIPASWIEAGKPTKEEIFDYIRNNQESFNTDIEALKQTATIDILDFSVGGFIAEYTSPQIDRFLPVFRAPVSGTITQVLVSLTSASTSGTLEIELDKSTDNGASWAPLLSAPVIVSGITAGSLSGAVSFISPALQDYNQNDMIRLRIGNIQVSQGSFHISIYGELA